MSTETLSLIIFMDQALLNLPGEQLHVSVVYYSSHYWFMYCSLMVPYINGIIFCQGELDFLTPGWLISLGGQHMSIFELNPVIFVERT